MSIASTLKTAKIMKYLECEYMKHTSTRRYGKRGKQRKKCGSNKYKKEKPNHHKVRKGMSHLCGLEEFLHVLSQLPSANVQNSNSRTKIRWTQAHSHNIEQRKNKRDR